MEQDEYTLPESRVKFMSYGNDWKHGATIEHVLMDLPAGRGEAAVGRIDVHIDENTGERSFRAFGSDGKELFGRRTSLYWLKKDFIRHEDELYATAVKNMDRPRSGESLEQLTTELKAGKNIRTAPILSPYVDDKKRSKAIKRIGKSKERSRGKSRGR